MVIYQDGDTPNVVSLNTSLTAGTTLTLGADNADFTAAYGTAPDIVDGTLTLLDGNDVVALKNSNNLLYDFYGKPGEPANANDYSMAWAYPGKSASRKEGISDPYISWTNSEWTIVDGVAQATLEPMLPATRQALCILAPHSIPLLLRPKIPFSFMLNSYPTL